MKPSEAAEILKGIEEFEGNLPEDGLLVEEAWGMAISALEKQEQDRWTPCKEKMPAKPFGCFVTVMDTNPITQEEFENILPYFVGWDGEQWNDADGEQIPCEVLAWRPLPKPYTEEDNDQP